MNTRFLTMPMLCATLATAASLVSSPCALADPLPNNNGAWPDQIPIDLVGFQPEGIELGSGHDFFVGGLSYSNWFGAPVSDLAGTVYKGNLLTGEGRVLVDPTGEPIAGLSYDPRTDNLYTVTNFYNSGTARAILVYDGTSGATVAEIPVETGFVLNDILVTREAIYCTDSVQRVLFKLPLDAGGRIPQSPVVAAIPLSEDFEMVNGDFNANGIVGRYDGEQVIVVNIATGRLFLIDTATGDARQIEVEGDETIFVNGDGIYLHGNTLYICQNFSNKVAVVQLAEDLKSGIFVKNLPENHDDPASNPLQIPTTITGFGDSIYAINTHFWEIAADPFEVQTLTEVVRLRK